MFGDNPLGWETLGTKETIKAATRETFLDYVDEWYTPDRMVVGVSGMVGDDLMPMLEELLGDMKPNGASPRPPSSTAPGAARRRPPQGCRPGPPDPRRAELSDRPPRPLRAADALGVLGSGMSSRLFLEVRERRGLAYYVHGMNHSYTDAGSLLAQAGVDIKRIDEAIKVIVEQFARMADEAVRPTSSRSRAR